MCLERFLASVIEKKRRFFGLLPLLWLLSKGFEGLIRLRHWAFDHRFLKVEQVDLPIISIGGIVAGGVGKTPFVEFLVRHLTLPQESIAILSRGFKSKIKGVVQLPKGKKDPTLFGDEPTLLNQKLKGPIILSKDRVAAARYAKAMGVKLAICDDAFQHRRLARAFDIVLLDGKAPFSNGHFLPRGWLRDIPERIYKARLLVFSSPPSFVCSQPYIVVKGTTTGAIDRQGIPLPKHVKKIALFCGIAHPERFLHFAKAQGFEVLETLFTPDHQLATKEKLQLFAREAKIRGAHCLLCTEKDFVKLSTSQLESLPLPTYFLSYQLKIESGEETFNAFLKEVKDYGIH